LMKAMFGLATAVALPANCRVPPDVSRQY
jgi:hypothetical protein